MDTTFPVLNSHCFSFHLLRNTRHPVTSAPLPTPPLSIDMVLPRTPVIQDLPIIAVDLYHESSTMITVAAIGQGRICQRLRINRTTEIPSTRWRQTVVSLLVAHRLRNREPLRPVPTTAPGLTPHRRSATRNMDEGHPYGSLMNRSWLRSENFADRSATPKMFQSPHEEGENVCRHRLHRVTS